MRHATYHWKALSKYISNIYTFMSQKPFNFDMKSLIIFVIFAKISLNSLSHDYYQKINYWNYRLIPIPIDSVFNVHQKEYFFKIFPCLVPEIFPLQTLFFQKLLISNFCSSQHCASCDISLASS